MFWSYSICVLLFLGRQGWAGIDRANVEVETQYNPLIQELGISAPENNPMVYFSAPGNSFIDMFMV